MGVVYFLHFLQLKEYFVRHIPNISVEMQESKKSNYHYLPTIPTFSEWQNSSEYRHFVGNDGIVGNFVNFFKRKSEIIPLIPLKLRYRNIYVLAE